MSVHLVEWDSPVIKDTSSQRLPVYESSSINMTDPHPHHTAPCIGWLRCLSKINWEAAHFYAQHYLSEPGLTLTHQYFLSTARCFWRWGEVTLYHISVHIYYSFIQSFPQYDKGMAVLETIVIQIILKGSTKNCQLKETLIMKYIIHVSVGFRTLAIWFIQSGHYLRLHTTVWPECTYKPCDVPSPIIFKLDNLLL